MQLLQYPFTFERPMVWTVSTASLTTLDEDSTLLSLSTSLTPGSVPPALLVAAFRALRLSI